MMFCPSCGLKDENSNQFCRACGTNLTPVRASVERGDSVTQSAANAREEIGRAVAARIRQTQSAKDLKIVAEEVLPELEKFLESPAEKRLRRLRTGTILGSIGAGASIAFGIISAFMGNDKEEFFFLAAMGLITFFIGLAFVINAFFASTPKKSIGDHSEEADRQRFLDSNQLVLPEARQEFVSVVEQTTRNLTKN